MALLTPQTGNGRSCCQDRRNRLPPYWGVDGTTSIEVCKVCQAKHTRIPLDSGKFGARVGRISA